MIGVWVMSKSFTDPLAGELPVAWSYGQNHQAHGYDKDSGWGLVWLSVDVSQIQFLKSGIDPNVEYIGTMHDKPTPLVLKTFAGKLGPGPFQQMSDVLLRLADSEPRFLEGMLRDPHKP